MNNKESQYLCECDDFLMKFLFRLGNVDFNERDANFNKTSSGRKRACKTVPSEARETSNPPLRGKPSARFSNAISSRKRRRWRDMQSALSNNTGWRVVYVSSWRVRFYALSQRRVPANVSNSIARSAGCTNWKWSQRGPSRRIYL